MKGKFIYILFIAIFLGVVSFAFAQQWKSTNNNSTKLVIPSNSSEEVIDSLIDIKLGIRLLPSFSWWAKQMNVDLNRRIVLSVKPKTNAWNLLKLLKNYKITNFDWVLQSSKSIEDVVDDIIHDYSSNTTNPKWNNEGLKKWFLTDSVYENYGLNFSTAHCLFIANTYNLNVSYSPRQFLDRMYNESFEKFWDSHRKNAAESKGCSIKDVVILASIVTKESNVVNEFGKIASVYKRRYHKRMLLQADPTVVFARGRSGRVLLSDTKINSPYNTYLHLGLPPGPLCIPDPKAIDSVLFGWEYKFLYFCARPDNSGTHNFAETLDEHNQNAKKYHQWLNARKL